MHVSPGAVGEHRQAWGVLGLLCVLGAYTSRAYLWWGLVVHRTCGIQGSWYTGLFGAPWAWHPKASRGWICVVPVLAD